LDDITTFDPTLPPKIVLNPGGIFSVKSDGTGFEFVVTTGMIAAAAANAAAAAASAAAALVSQNAAAASAGAAAIMQWQKVTLTFDQFAAAALSNSQPLFTLPAKQLLIGLMIKHSVPFAGPAVASLALGVGVAGDTGKFITAFDGLQAVADTAYESNLEQYMGSFAGSTAIQVTATSSGANLSALTQGSVDVWYQAAQLP
jgi:hypothetical protein